MKSLLFFTISTNCVMPIYVSIASYHLLTMVYLQRNRDVDGGEESDHEALLRSDKGEMIADKQHTALDMYEREIINQDMKVTRLDVTNMPETYIAGEN